MKLLLKLIIGLVLILGILAIYVLIAWNKNFEAQMPKISAVSDSSYIARGKYLVYGPAHCASCHVPIDRMREAENGVEVPLIGGFELEIPLGTFRAPNITPDPETGIGNISDQQIARALRYSVSHNNKLVMNFMPFQEMSDDDIKAVLSYLRSTKPVKNDAPKTEYTFLGKALLAFGALKPQGPINEPPKSVTIDSSIKYGKYLAYSVANCYGCHTERDMKSGIFIGEPFAGGMIFPPDKMTKGNGFIAPNITPEDPTSYIGNWTEKAFVERFKMGAIYDGTPMPWGSFKMMSESDLKAIYRYLQTVNPVENRINKVFFANGEEITKK